MKHRQTRKTLLWVFTLFLLAFSASADQIWDSCYTTTPSGANYGQIHYATDNTYYQGWDIDNLFNGSVNITNIEVELYKVGTPPSTYVYAIIYNNSAGIRHFLANSTNTIARASIGITRGVETFNFTFNYVVPNGTSISIAVDASPGVNTSDNARMASESGGCANTHYGSNTLAQLESGDWTSGSETIDKRWLVYFNDVTPPPPPATITFIYPINESTLSFFSGYINFTTSINQNCTMNDTRFNNDSFNSSTNHSFYSTSTFGTGDYVVNISCTDISSNLIWYVRNSIVEDVTYSNYTAFAGNNYTRRLNYAANVSCPNSSNTTLEIYINSTFSETVDVACLGSTNKSPMIGTVQYTTEGPFNISFLLNTTDTPEISNVYVGNATFIFDLINPVVFYNFTILRGFFNPLTDITLKCTDSISPNMTYNITLNNVTLFYRNETNGTNITNSSVVLVTGNNTLISICTDLVSETIATNITYIYTTSIVLIDEKDNVVFDVTNITGAKVYFDDNSTLFDFIAEGNISRVNFTSGTDEKLRFEFEYPNSIIITRYIDTSLIGETLRICANKDDVTHFEQLIISATEREAILENVFSKCLVAADYTRFAYQDSNLLKAFTIESLYFLRIYQANREVLLASVDGSIATYINIDTIEFSQTSLNLNIMGDTLSFEDNGTSQILIYYKSLDLNKIQTGITITNLDDSSIVFTTSETADPNEFILFFNFVTLNLSNSTVFKIEVATLDNLGISDTFTKYFNVNANSGILNTAFTITMSILIVFFGLTFTISRTTFSWFGIIMMMAAIAVLTFAISTEIVLFLQAMEIIILIYIILIMTKKNFPTVA